MTIKNTYGNIDVEFKSTKKEGVESMTDTIKLEIALIQKGKTKKDLAHLLKVSLQTIYNKVNNLVDFKTQEVKAISDFLGLEPNEMMEIFFTNNVEK